MLDPYEYKNGEHVGAAVEVGETVSTASDKVTLGPAKAIAAMAATVAVAFLTALGVAISDNMITASEWVTISISTLVATGLVGGTTALVPTTVTGKNT